MTYSDQLRRLQVAATTGRIPPDLARWALSELVERGPDTGRIQLRDQLLRETVVTLLPESSTWARATALRAEILALDRRHGELDGVTALVAEALELDPSCPRSVRHLFRVLTG